jgi:hypothetical protein
MNKIESDFRIPVAGVFPSFNGNTNARPNLGTGAKARGATQVRPAVEKENPA